MVEPSALAETVTPSIFSPAVDLIDPLSTTSAASAEETMMTRLRHRAVVVARLVAIRLQVIASSPDGRVDGSARLIGRRGCGRCGDRQGLDVGHDGVDLVGLEM